MTESMQKARAVALDILKPSARDLEYGLALHEEALVIESYGLGLMAPVDPERLNAAIDAGASPKEIGFLSTDMRMTRWADTSELRREYEEAWRVAGVSCTFQNAGEEGNSPVRLLERLARHTYLSDAIPEVLQRATTPDDIVAAHKAGKRCKYLTCNGVPLAGEQANVQEELRYLSTFAQLGARMMHLTYNRRNAMGDGCGEPANAGLSDFGAATVAEMNRLGIIIDLAHSGWQTTLDTAKLSRRPVVISHATAWEVNQHVRSKSDEVIRAVLETGGTMGITNVPAFLGGKGDISAFLDHIDYVAKTFGADAVTIGTDRCHNSEGMMAAQEKVREHRPSRMRWEALWPAGDPLFSPEWRQPRQELSMAWTNWPMFTVGMVQRGYSDEDILKILGGNMLRVSQDVWRDTALARADSRASEEADSA